MTKTNVIRVVNRAELEERQRSARAHEGRRFKTAPLKVSIGDMLRAKRRKRPTP